MENNLSKLISFLNDLQERKWFYIIYFFACCLLLSACNSNSTSVDILEPTFTPGTIIQPTDITTFTPSVEAFTPFIETPEPSERPTNEPVKTVDNTASPVSTLTPTPTHMPTPKPDHLISYYHWLLWREANPEEYSKWQELPMPDTTEFDYLSNIDESTWKDIDNYYKYRFWIDLLDDGFIYDLVDVFPEKYYSSGSSPISLLDPPIFYIDLIRFDIPKQELLEYEKWVRLYYNMSIFSLDEIDLLFSDDLEGIRQHFKLPRYVFCYNDLIFLDDEIRFSVSPFDIGRMFTPETYKAFIDDFDKKMQLYDIENPIESAQDQLDPWEEYERIKQRDAAELTMEAAEEMIGEFMNLYRNLRYSPDDIAGDTPDINIAATGQSWLSDKCILKDSTYVNRLLFSILSFDMTGYYNYVIPKQIMDCGDRYYPYFRWVISMDPKFYQGEIEPFDDDYTLADHINIVYTDNEDAYVELTARKRDGSGEAVYTVNFKKSYERWRISSGTMLDLISPVD